MTKIIKLNRPGPLEYTIKHRSRVTRRLHMELDENGGLVVVAPRHWSRAHISALLASNTPRVERFLARARVNQLQPLLYTHGELHLYLGARYPLAIHHEAGARGVVGVSKGCVDIRTSSIRQENIKNSLQRWYRREATRVFSERLAQVAQRAPWVDGRSTPLKLRRMKRTWGNCSAAGEIKLNTHLVKAPLPIIDSVIAHELCHLVEMNHGKAFYRLLDKLNPDWRRDRASLRTDGPSYLLT